VRLSGASGGPAGPSSARGRPRRRAPRTYSRRRATGRPPGMTSSHSVVVTAPVRPPSRGRRPIGASPQASQTALDRAGMPAASSAAVRERPAALDEGHDLPFGPGSACIALSMTRLPAGEIVNGSIVPGRVVGWEPDCKKCRGSATMPSDRHECASDAPRMRYFRGRNDASDTDPRTPRASEASARPRRTCQPASGPRPPAGRRPQVGIHRRPVTR